MNDNLQILPAIAPINIQAENSRRKIVKKIVTDINEDDSIRFRILHVLNGGKRTFYVNPSTGDARQFWVKTLLFFAHRNKQDLFK